MKKRKVLVSERSGLPAGHMLDGYMFRCAVWFLIFSVMDFLIDPEYPLEVAIWGFCCTASFLRISCRIYSLKNKLLFRVLCWLLVSLFALLLLTVLVGALAGYRVSAYWYHLYFTVSLFGIFMISFSQVAERIRERSWMVQQVHVHVMRNVEALRLFVIICVFLYLLLTIRPDSLAMYVLAGLASGLNLVLMLYLLSDLRLNPTPARKEEMLDEVGLRTIQERLVSYFEEKKPYLKPDLKINDVALAVFTNKTYVSKVLNEGMNMNFNQYVNSYRIREAQEIYRENPELKMNELSEMCGFRTIPSFYKAFKDNVGDSPANWCRNSRQVQCQMESIKGGSDEKS